MLPDAMVVAWRCLLVHSQLAASYRPIEAVPLGNCSACAIARNREKESEATASQGRLAILRSVSHFYDCGVGSA